MTLKQYELEDIIQDYASQARAVLTSQLGLDTEDDSLDYIIEEEITNAMLSLIEYEYETIKDIVESPEQEGLTKQEIIEHLGLEESLVDKYDVVLNKLEDLNLEDVAFWEDLDVHVEDTGFQKIYFGVMDEVVAIGIKPLNDVEDTVAFTEEDLVKKLNEKTIKADKLDILKDDIHDNIIAVNEKETVYGIILSTGTLRQLSEFLMNMGGGFSSLDTMVKGLVVVKYFDTKSGAIQNYLVERKWYDV